MNQHQEKLKKFIVENRIQAKHLHFDGSCHSVEDAAKAANVEVEDVIKNICLITSEETLVLAIIKGENRVSTQAIASMAIRTASSEEILEKTGYPCGGHPLLVLQQPSSLIQK